MPQEQWIEEVREELLRRLSPDGLPLAYIGFLKEKGWSETTFHVENKRRENVLRANVEYVISLLSSTRTAERKELISIALGMMRSDQNVEYNQAIDDLLQAINEK